MSGTLKKQLLLGAVNIIKDPERWTRGNHRLGDRFCALGAIQEAGHNLGLSHRVAEKIVGEGVRISLINDIFGRRAVILYMRWRAAMA